MNNNLIFCYGNGFSDFILSTHELATGLNTEDEGLIIKLWNNDKKILYKFFDISDNFTIKIID